MATSGSNSGSSNGAAANIEPAAQPAARAVAAPIPAAKMGAIYTATAAQGFDSATLINAAMANKHVGKTVQRRVVVAEPDGPSTSGGKHARQTITLAPVTAGQGGTVMCGWLDVAKKMAGLRDFRAVSDQYKGRYGAVLDITAEDYLGIVRDLEGLMKTIGVVATHEITEPAKQAAKVAENIAEPEPEEPAIKPTAMVLAAVLLVGAVGAIVWLMR